MKFGAVANQGGVNWPELLDFWQELDAVPGIESLWLMDHFVTGFGQEFGSEGPCFEGWTTLAALAQATNRAKIGILVSGNFYRNPAILAKQATTVDHISGGRLILGIGAGWHEYESQAYGLGIPSVKERMDRLEEASHIIRSLFTEQRPSFSGKYYTLDRAPYNPPNVQQNLPLLIGGSGEKRTLKIVGKYADMANVSGSPEDARRKWDLLDGYARDAGRDPGSIRRTMQIPLFLSDDPAFKERVLQGMTAARGGTPEEAAAQLLIGTPDEIIEQIKGFEAAGTEEIYVALWPRFQPKPMRRFIAEVLPAFA